MRRLLPRPGPAHRHPAASRGSGADGPGGLHAVRFRALPVRSGKYDGGTSGGIRLTGGAARDSSTAVGRLHGGAGHPFRVSAAVGHGESVSAAVARCAYNRRGSTAVGCVPSVKAVFAD